ncbi:hypothetical protein MKW98_000723 [Papaver atlanticum]|uniref:Uncharacterized protein n=1 Tax=Papaver atlanticum TaxID=357466 RepID=A0AAD4XBJ1_9MAGN|nr:hypothetical protein MKW98_000723 [Papaver atlanticum]
MCALDESDSKESLSILRNGDGRIVPAADDEIMEMNNEKEQRRVPNIPIRLTKDHGSTKPLIPESEVH